MQNDYKQTKHCKHAQGSMYATGVLKKKKKKTLSPCHTTSPLAFAKP